MDQAGTDVGNEVTRGGAGTRTLRVEVVAPEAVRWTGVADQVVVPGSSGSLGILPGRQPLLTTLTAGEVRVHDLGGRWHSFEVGGGFVSVWDDVVEVLDC